MKVALVHDYIKEFGGAERVLKTLSDMYPEAPIYTAFRVRGSNTSKVFKNKKMAILKIQTSCSWHDNLRARYSHRAVIEMVATPSLNYQPVRLHVILLVGWNLLRN